MSYSRWCFQRLCYVLKKCLGMGELLSIYNIDRNIPSIEAGPISVLFFFSEIPDFSVHILPKGDIWPEATEIHGLEKRSGRLFLRGDPIPSVTLYQALEQFQSWILKYFYENSTVLVSFIF